MRNGVFVRKWSTAAQRAKAVTDYRASGLTQREFAARAGISVGTLGNWLRQAGNPPAAEPVSFLELPRLGTAARAAYKVHLPQGLALEVPSGFAASEVKELLRLLGEL